MAINFPNNPADGQNYVYMGMTFTYKDTGGGGFWRVIQQGQTGVATGAEVDEGIDNVKYVSPKALKDSNYGKGNSAIDDVFYQNKQTVTVDFIGQEGMNYMSAGPIVIEDGIAVTIPDGSNWSIV